MATRRRYKTPQGYKDGGAVIADDVAPMPEVSASASEPLPPASPPDIPPAQASTAIQRALEATRQAEAMQRQAAQQQAAPLQPTPEQIIDQAADLSRHKREFLKAHPEMFFDPVTRQAAASAYQNALRLGVPDDTPAMNEHILDAVRRAGSREPAVEHSAHRLDLEAAAMRMAAATAASPSPIAADMPAPAPPRRSGIPMSAPVSRDVPSASGRRMSDMRSIKLSPEERDIARRSYSAPDMTDDDKERAYAAAKSRMLYLARTRGDE